MWGRGTDRTQNCKSCTDFSHSSCARQLMSLSDKSICSLCDKPHTTKHYLSESHMRHDPLLVAIYPKRQRQSHLGTHVIRKMTPSKTWVHRGQYFFFVFSLSVIFLSVFWLWEQYGIFHLMDVLWQRVLEHTNAADLGMRFSSLRLTRWPLCCPHDAEIQTEALLFTKPLAPWLLGWHWCTAQGNHLVSFIRLGIASLFLNQASTISESVHTLAGGQSYGQKNWQSTWHAEQACFSGLGMAGSFLKSWPSSDEHSAWYFQPLLGSPRDPISSRQWAPFWKWSKTHSQLSISHANGGEQWCRQPKIADYLKITCTCLGTNTAMQSI